MEVSNVVGRAHVDVMADCALDDRIPRIQGGQEVTFSGHAQLTSTTTRQVWARPPIDIDFQVLMFTSSGLIVRFLKVFEKSNYQSVKWVRYLTKASGSYQIRVSTVSTVACCQSIDGFGRVVLR